MDHERRNADHMHGERLARLEEQNKAQTKILVEICRDTKAIRKDQSAHDLKDERRFGKIEADQRWTKIIGGLFVSALQGLHFWK